MIHNPGESPNIPIILAEVAGLDGDAMRGTDDAALAAVLGALDSAEASGAVTAADVVMAYIKQIVTNTNKIDSVAADGLLGTFNSLAYLVNKIERHLHSRERWLGLAGASEGFAPYALPVGDAGTFGAWTEILDAADTPIIAGSLYYDPHRILLTDVPKTKALLFMQFAWGPVAATAYSNEDYSEFYTVPEKPADGKASPIIMQLEGLPVDTLLWARAKQEGADEIDGTVDFFIGIHEYEG